MGVLCLGDWGRGGVGLFWFFGGDVMSLSLIVVKWQKPRFLQRAYEKRIIVSLDKTHSLLVASKRKSPFLDNR